MFCQISYIFTCSNHRTILIWYFLRIGGNYDIQNFILFKHFIWVRFIKFINIHNGRLGVITHRSYRVFFSLKKLSWDYSSKLDVGHPILIMISHDPWRRMCNILEIFVINTILGSNITWIKEYHIGCGSRTKISPRAVFTSTLWLHIMFLLF